MGEQKEKKPIKRICAGLLAHVDAGKTTLSEAMLYESGAIRRLGRVDHGDAFLDTEALERERGITIFSKQARLSLPECDFTLLDTPGHVDFSSEMERTLQVLDCAVLVISGTDGVQAHTRTLWKLLERYHVPTFLFVNKMDLAGVDREGVLEQLCQRLSGNCADFTDLENPDTLEEIALCDEGTMERYLETGTLTDGELAALVAERKVFPCWFGSALKLEGVQELLRGLVRFAPQPAWPETFGAKVYKIGRDPQGGRLTYLKVTGGALKVKDTLTGTTGGEEWSEKVDQIRLYSGAKFRTVDRVEGGQVCAVTGLSHTWPGEGLGAEPDSLPPALEPVLTYRMILPQGCDPHAVLPRLRTLEEEDPQLHLLWKEELGELHVQLMGEVQLDVLRSVLEQRFGLAVEFDAGNIVYKETIAAPVEGVGHFEPLRHYAEVHLILEPGERESGLTVATACSEDQLDRNWQRLILTHLLEREHPGVLTGSPITDLNITLAAGKAHLKHTEGGDFRQATYRAIRQGLRKAENILLEPWYEVRLELPAALVGRAMTDLQQMGGTCNPPETVGEEVVLTGAAPVAALRGYQREVNAYSKGQGRLFCTLRGYEPCGNQEAVVEALGYDPDRDTANPADSVFCDHGAGVVVKWDQVEERMHLPPCLTPEPPVEEVPAAAPPVRSSRPGPSLEQDKELLAIYERTYGKVERNSFRPQPKPARTSLDEKTYNIQAQNTGPEYLLVDGYNIIHAWDELKELAKTSLDAARKALMDLLSNYQGFRKCELILVFDAYRVKGNPGSVAKYHNLYVVYTKEAETADNYIEKVTYEIGRKHRVRVATSDGVEQLIILGHGALRVSARTFRQEIEEAQGQISSLIAQNNRSSRILDQLQFRLPPLPGKTD